jgi:hypothetical protein
MYKQKTVNSLPKPHKGQFLTSHLLFLPPLSLSNSQSHHSTPASNSNSCPSHFFLHDINLEPNSTPPKPSPTQPLAQPQLDPHIRFRNASLHTRTFSLNSNLASSASNHLPQPSLIKNPHATERHANFSFLHSTLVRYSKQDLEGMLCLRRGLESYEVRLLGRGKSSEDEDDGCGGATNMHSSHHCM